MLVGILFLTVPIITALLCYRMRKFERKLIKKIPVIDWFNALILPFFIYVGMVIIIKSIISRPEVPILDIDSFYIAAILLFFFLYAFIGNSVHFVSKVLERFIEKDKHNQLYQINEVFHNKLSHYLSFICSIATAYGVSLLEINHPAENRLDRQQAMLIVIFGGLCGLATAKGIFIWIEKLRRNNKALSTLCLLLFIIQINTISILKLNMLYFPFNRFIFSFLACILLAFFLRHLTIILKLDTKRRLKYISTLLSVNE